MSAITFPRRGSDDVHTWTPYVRFIALAPKVGVMARSRIEGAWSAYITDIPGISHRAELQERTFDRANKLSESVARAIFPEFEGVAYAD
jgi:hypothetical protein